MIDMDLPTIVGSISTLLMPFEEGLAAGVFLGILGFLKNAASKADPNSDTSAKLAYIASHPFDWKLFGSTLLITCGLSITAFELIKLGVPTEVLLAAVPLGMRDTFKDAMTFGSSILNKPEAAK